VSCPPVSGRMESLTRRAARPPRPGDDLLIRGLISSALAGHGISLRNDDVFYGHKRLQDMLNHETARLVLGVLRLAAEPRGLADVWLEVTATLVRIDDDDAARPVRQRPFPLHPRPAHVAGRAARVLDSQASQADAGNERR
jgi:hypothetical protein